MIGQSIHTTTQDMSPTNNWRKNMQYVDLHCGV